METDHVHVGWNPAEKTILLTLLGEDESLTLRIGREEFEELLPHIALALFELNSPQVTANLTPCPTHDRPAHGEMPLYGPLEAGGFWAVMCPKCSTLGGHSVECPDSPGRPI